MQSYFHLLLQLQDTNYVVAAQPIFSFIIH